MLRYWPTTEELTMYRLQGYDIAITDESGTNGTYGLFECTLDGNYHREDGPAFMRVTGKNWLLVWYQHGSPHREDGPAMICPDGSREWYQAGNLHRIDGPAFADSCGEMLWGQNDETHREDGPAIIKGDGELWWYQYDEPHRDDGPAAIHPNGSLEWWLDGNHYQTREEWLVELKKRRGSC